MAIAFGKYVLLRRIATGGMGEVFLARPKEGGKEQERLVIKRILPHLAEDADFHDMFLDEARIAAQLNHPNLVQIFEVGEVGESVYLAMEYVHGEDLRSVERAAHLEGMALPFGASTHIVACAAAGLEHAHGLVGPDGKKLNLVHRDVSPQNILVGFDGAVKLIDFGVAKAAGVGQPTVTGVLKGKVSYMSPEQAAGDEIDARSDVFSLGVVWWELLTGRRLFKGSSDQMTMRLVLGCQVPPPTRLVAGLPPSVDAITARVLTRRPEDRYAHVGQFHRALEELLDSQRVVRKPAPHIPLLKQLFPERAASPDSELAEGADADGDAVPDRRVSSLPSLPGRGNLGGKGERENTVSVTRISPPVPWRVWLLGGVFGLFVVLGLWAVWYYR